MKVLLVTGGAGFIGSNFTKFFLSRNKNFIVVNIDKLTYAGKLHNLKDLENSPRYHFIKGDICNRELVDYILKRFRPDYVINFAAETHVDRSINHPSIFAETNIIGTLALLESLKYLWGKQDFKGNRFIQISTDEVYGSTGSINEYFLEESSLAPNNPYSASKAGADMLVKAFSKTYGFPAIITRCCNNYGPRQDTEKFIPKCISNALQDKPIPIYGDGSNIREWIHVMDHCIGIIKVIFHGRPGEVYNIGSGEEISNIELAKRILKIMGKPEELLNTVEDRPGHDKRYALNSYKIRNSINWANKITLDIGLKETIKWYKDNSNWLQP